MEEGGGGWDRELGVVDGGAWMMCLMAMGCSMSERVCRRVFSILCRPIRLDASLCLISNSFGCVVSCFLRHGERVAVEHDFGVR